MAMRAQVPETFQDEQDVQMPMLRGYNIDHTSGQAVWLSPDQRARAGLGGRPILASFRGSHQPWPHPWFHLRWRLAALEEKDFEIELLCGKNKVAFPTDNWGGDRYAEMLLSSTFVFSPGGGGIDDARLWEALAAGAIPIVFGGVVLPFQRVTPWDDCVVRADSGRLRSLPQLLRNMSAAERARRVAACSGIFEHRLSSGRALARSIFDNVASQIRKQRYLQRSGVLRDAESGRGAATTPQKKPPTAAATGRSGKGRGWGEQKRDGTANNAIVPTAAAKEEEEEEVDPVVEMSTDSSFLASAIGDDDHH